MTAAGIFNHAVTAAQALTGKAAAPTADSTAGAAGTSGTNNSSGASSNSATISANDFLTLLVTEMQNQDPTADTDPNEYINQLVQVNSLEQLIDINQTLTTDLGSTTQARAVARPERLPGQPPARRARAPGRLPLRRTRHMRREQCRRLNRTLRRAARRLRRLEQRNMRRAILVCRAPILQRSA